jgi:hypothetical protein
LTGRCGIETESYPVIIEDVVAAADRRPDLIGLGIETVKSEVQITIVIRDANVCAKWRFFARERIIRNPIS